MDGNCVKMFVRMSILLAIGNYCWAAKILCIYPTPCFSHQQPMLTLSYALAEKGHNVTVITPNPSKETVKNLREIDVSSIYEDWEVIQKQSLSFQKRNSALDLVKNMCNFFHLFMESIGNKPQLLEFIRELNETQTKYDLILYEPLSYSGLLGFAEIVGNPPIVGLTTLHSFSAVDDLMGNPTTLSYIPQVFLPLTDRMTLFERFLNLCIDVYFKYTIEVCFKPMQEKHLKKLFGYNLKNTALELEYNKSFLIVSNDLSTGYPKPLQPNTIQVGSMHLKSPKPLPEDLQKWMDESEDGVIYFSLGSNMKGTSVPENIRSAFIKAFQQFPRIRFLWKWEGDTKIPNQPDNVLTKKWVLQQSVLAHPKLRVFISQVGLQSVQEAMANGVPILAVPIYGDQDFNAKKLVKDGAGISIEFNDITQNIIYKNLKSLLTNSSYKENMMKLSLISKDKLMSSLDTAVWWIEYIIRHKGARHLRPSSLDLSLYQYYMLDVLGLIFLTLCIIFYLFYFIVKKLFLSTKNKLKTN